MENEMETTIWGLGLKINVRDPFTLFLVWDFMEKGSFSPP